MPPTFAPSDSPPNGAFFWGYGYFALCAQYAYAARLFRALRSIHRAYRLLAHANTPLVALSPVGDTGSGYGYFALCAQYAYAARLFRAYRPIFLTNARFS